MMLDGFGETITIVPNPRKNEADIVYSSNITPADLAAKLKHLNIYKEAGKRLRDLLLKVDFGLGHSFCDADDLKDAWENHSMPDEICTFFSSFFQTPKYKLFKPPEFDLPNVQAESENENRDNQDQGKEITEDEEDDMRLLDKRSIQIFCVYQILVYMLNNGRLTVPLHTMVGQSQYTRDRSKSMITVLNHIAVSDSYTKVKRRRNLLMSYAIQNAKENIPLPSNITKYKGDFTQVATDNSNYLDRSSMSGKEQKNYSASEVFQDATKSETPRKPKVSETGLDPKFTPAIRKELACQKVSQYIKPKERPNLSGNMKIVPETTGQTEILDMKKARSDAELKEFLITCLRVGVFPPYQDTPLWQAVHTLVSKAIVPLSRVDLSFLSQSRIMLHAINYASTLKMSESRSANQHFLFGVMNRSLTR